jgi:ribosomal protein S18 acetylase RimI-like enzyme
MQTFHSLVFELNPDPLPGGQAVLNLFDQVGLLESGWNLERITRALASSDIVVSVRNEVQLIGIGRVITDWARTAYLCSLAVAPDFQGRGIGRQIVERMRERLGPEVALMVHSVPGAKSFYESLGFEPRLDVYRLPRQR